MNLNDCFLSFGENASIVLVTGLHAHVDKEVVENVVGRHGVPGRYSNDERMIKLCAERELEVGNTLFKKMDYIIKHG